MIKIVLISVLAVGFMTSCKTRPTGWHNRVSTADSVEAALEDTVKDLSETGNGWSAIEGTDYFVYVSDSIVRSKDGKVSFPVRPDEFGVEEYVGCMGDIHVFANPGQVFFSDGRQADFYLSFTEMAVDKEKMQITWQMGCEQFTMSIARLHEMVKRGIPQPQCVRSFRIRINGVESEMNVMKISAYAKRIPQKVACDFSKNMAHCVFEDSIKPYKGADMLSMANYYGKTWKENFEASWQGEESYPFEIIKVNLQKVTDNARYLTTYYMGNYYYGGAHGAHHSFYTTYDKKLDKILDVSDIVKDDKFAEFREVAYKELLRLKQERTNAGLQEYEGSYRCCGEGEFRSELNEASDLVLQHVAVLPQGISLSYHPYQLGAPWEGEYHVLIPYDKIKACLKFDYSKVKTESFDFYRLFDWSV